MKLSYRTRSVDTVTPELANLIYNNLYRDWGVPRDHDWLQAADGGYFLMQLLTDDDPTDDADQLGEHVPASCGKLTGALRLMPVDPEHPDRQQIRQVAVDPDLRGRGLGRALMDRARQWAAEHGARVLWLKARKPAWGFYERLGYTRVSELYLSPLTKIPHITMELATMERLT
ncbi:MAG: GNAT family N-acetyltransferase [Actinomycetes bacterium]|jgi:predicted GNAT family N-acyltransferase|nr:GNAT family N-acetyltransferase [Actinomycetes bacterium]